MEPANWSLKGVAGTWTCRSAQVGAGGGQQEMRLRGRLGPVPSPASGAPALGEGRGWGRGRRHQGSGDPPRGPPGLVQGGLAGVERGRPSESPARMALRRATVTGSREQIWPLSVNVPDALGEVEGRSPEGLPGWALLLSRASQGHPSPSCSPFGHLVHQLALRKQSALRGGQGAGQGPLCPLGLGESPLAAQGARGGGEAKPPFPG